MPPPTTHQQLKAWRERLLRGGGGSIAERRQFNAALRSSQLRGGGLFDAAEPDEHPLYLAVAKGDVRRVRKLLKSGMDPDKAEGNSVQNTPLIRAAYDGNASLVQLLLKYKANPDKEATFWDITPISEAAKAGHAKVVKLLLDAGANPNKGIQRAGNQMPIEDAAENGHEAVVELLLAHGANPNATRRDSRMTPLFHAAKEGHAGVVKILLNAGADPNKADEYHGSPCSAAAKRGHEDVVQMLLAAGAEDCGWYRNLGKRIRGAFRQVADDSESVGDDLFG